MKNKIGLISGFMISGFVHFGIALFAFLFLKEQAPIQKELFHAISLNDFVAPKVEQNAPPSAAQSKQTPTPTKKEQEAPKKVEQKTQNIAPKPKNTQNSKNSQVLENSKVEQTAQNNAATKENSAKSLAKEQDEIAAQIYKIISAYIAKNYPKDALRRNQSGSVTISFNYSPSGVSNAQILQSSNIKSLDNASLNAIEKTKHLFPKTDKNFVFKLPVRFAIK